jgi:tRNA pseudouridine55 synthase
MVEPIRNYDFLKGEVLLFDKGLGWSSFDLVQKVRNSLCRAMNIKKLKVGHAGTLDPLATGLMILCTGQATKQIETMQSGQKEYLATLKLGATTPTHDRESEEDQNYPYQHLTRSSLEKVLQKYTGTIAQEPPLFSAVKIKGKRAYHYAREGENIKLKSRMVVIQKVEIVRFDLPAVDLNIVCSKGTYIRSLARDIGKSLKCGAYLTHLRRLRIGKYHVKEAMTIEYFLHNLNAFVTN